MKDQLLTVAVLLLAAAIPATVGAQLPEGVEDSMIATGETLYKSLGLCFACHGPTGAGVPGAGVNLQDDEWLHGDGSFPSIVEQILKGVGPTETKSGVVMLPKGGSQVTDEQVRAIASYVWAFRLREDVPASHDR